MEAPKLTPFHILADLSHAGSKVILIWSFYSNRSAEGVSLLTQALYCLVFATRYLDVFKDPLFQGALGTWNTCFKFAYFISSLYIIYLMMRVFARTREKEYGWKLAMWSLLGSFLAAPLVNWLLEGWSEVTFIEVFWTFSEILESVCILPQLLLLRQTSVPTVIDSYYLVALGSYRAFYVVNWFILMFDVRARSRPELPTSTIFGIIQTLFYIDFAWVYYTRQRVKLRGGGIVDGEDLSKSFIVNRFIGRRQGQNGAGDEEDLADEDDALAAQENGVIRPRASNRWGARGISISADDTLHEHENIGDAQMVDPSHFEDDAFDDEDEADAPPPPAKDVPLKPVNNTQRPVNSVENSAGEWQDDGEGR